MKWVIRFGTIFFTLSAIVFAYILWLCYEITKDEK